MKHRDDIDADFAPSIITGKAAERCFELQATLFEFSRLFNWYATSPEWLELQVGKNEKLKNISNKGKALILLLSVRSLYQEFSNSIPLPPQRLLSLARLFKANGIKLRRLVVIGSAREAARQWIIHKLFAPEALRTLAGGATLRYLHMSGTESLSQLDLLKQS